MTNEQLPTISESPSLMVKLLSAICFISASVWVGTTVAFMTVGYDLFITGTATLRNQPAELQAHTIRLASQIAGYTIGSYVTMAVCGIILGILSRTMFKKHGYAMMAFGVLLLFLPVQGFLLFQDYSLTQYFPDRSSIGNLNISDAVAWSVRRLTTYSLPGILSLLAHISAIGILAWKPLKRS
jgi:hypothetical protein